MSAWDVLGLTPDASASEVQAAYRRLVFDVHPDRGGTADAFRRVHEAAVECLLEATSTEEGEPADEDGWPLRLAALPGASAGFWERRVEPVIDATFALGAVVLVLGVGYVAVILGVTLVAIVVHAALVPILRALTPG